MMNLNLKFFLFKFMSICAENVRRGVQQPSVKNSGGSVIVKGFIPASGVGDLVKNW